MTYDTVIVGTTSDLEYRVKFDSVEWDDRVDMLTAFWAELAEGGVFITTDGHAVRFNMDNINVALVEETPPA